MHPRTTFDGPSIGGAVRSTDDGAAVGRTGGTVDPRPTVRTDLGRFADEYPPDDCGR